MDKILITGGSGLVGSAIKKISIEYPSYQFIFASSKDCDFTNWENTIEYFRLIAPDYVIHLAANVGGLFKNMNYKVQMLEQNLLININVLKASHEIGVKKVVSCLSTCIFPDKVTYPIDESMLHIGPPHYSNDAYAYAKRLLEIQSYAYQQQYNDNFICVIPTNIYGESDNFHLENAHVIPALIHKCYLAKKTSTPFIVSGTGKPLRQFIYSQDLAKLIMIVLEKYNKKESIILSVDEKDEVSIGTVANIIAKYMDYNNIEFNTSLSDGQFKKTANNKKLRDLVGDFSFTPIKKGISNTVDWFITNYDACRK